MSDSNRADGRACYTEGDAETRSWFEGQWALWPIRVHNDRTTNISFHHGAVQAFREIHDRDPLLSRDFAGHVKWLDQHGGSHD